MDTAAVLKELETKRLAARRGYIFFGLMNVILLLFLITRRVSLALVILALELVYYFFLARPDIKGYTAAFREQNAAAAMSGHMDNAAYRSRGGIDREVILADRLLPVKPGSSCITYHRVTGEKDRMELELSDVSFQLEDAEAKRPVFLTGCWVRVRLDHSPGKSLRLVARTLVNPDLQREWFLNNTSFRPMGWGREPLDDLFCCYAGEGTDPSLPEAVLAHIDELAKATPAPFAIGIDGEILTFMFHRRYVTFPDPGLKRAVTREDLERDPLPELDQVIRLARAYRRAEG